MQLDKIDTYYGHACEDSSWMRVRLIQPIAIERIVAAK